MTSRWFAALAALVLAAAGTLAQAHHSFAMFDMTKTVTYKGTIKELQWTNPHVWLELTVQEKDGPVTYSFEGAAIAVLKRVGWTRNSVKAGDVVTVVGHPYKDGRPGGSIDHLILPDGRKLGTGDAIPGALRVPGVG
ncbi:MAG TPA: DUF6152 family protein [Steroidobacteraceae bacterium]|nr:DUF6152 family protein [Steroidobacteraceae bacterium]